jgi:uncharacterized protein YndB with AHSA1/START domain
MRAIASGVKTDVGRAICGAFSRILIHAERKIVKRVLLAGLLVIIALILAVAIAGAMLPKQHVSTRAARFRQSPDAIWAAVTDYTKFPAWRKDVAQIEPLPDVNGKPSWREFDRHGRSIPFQVMVAVPPKVFVVRIADPTLPFGGTWTYEIAPARDGSSSLLRITENGEIYNPVFRFVARFILGYSQTQDQYLRALGTKFGETASIEN